MTISNAEKILLAAWGSFLLCAAALSSWVIAGGAPQAVQGNMPDLHARADDTHGTTKQDISEAVEPAAGGRGHDESSDDPHTVDEAMATPGGHDPASLDAGNLDTAGLYEESPYGPLPRIAADGRHPWQAFAQHHNLDPSKPGISIIIMGLGLGQAASQSVIADLPQGFTLAFSPYGRNVDALSNAARVKGHELLLMVPMEPLRYPDNDPGPDTLLRGNSAEENIDRLHKVMGRLQGYVGLINDMGSSFTANEAAINPVLNETKIRGLMFVDARSTNFSVAASLAQSLDMPIAFNNRYIDEEPSREDIASMLETLVSIAKTTGSAVGIARPLPITVTLLQEWASKIEAEGQIQLVGISAIANSQAIR